MSSFTNLSNLIDTFAAPLGTLGRPDAMNRYAGGHARHNQPYVSGYWYLLMTPPSGLLRGNQKDATSWLHATAESFTPPSKTVTKVDVPAMGGVASSFVAGQELSRTFTVAFREWQGLPIMNILQAWTNAIDARSGISPLTNFIPSEYKGTAYVALCRPTVTSGAGAGIITSKDIEQLFYFDGIFPETLPFDTLTSDIATNDTAQLSVTFSFDGWPATRENQKVLNGFLEEASTNSLSDASSTIISNTIDTASSVFDGASNARSVIGD